jgi:putative ABC transport system permease protein
MGRWGTFFVVRTAGDAGPLPGALSDALLAVDPDLSVGAPGTLESAEVRALVRPRFQALVLLVFALSALALSAGGVYAVVSYSVARRVREMGIRMALGAGAGEVVGIVMRSSLLVASAGVALGLVGALASARAIRGMVHGVDPVDPLSLGLAGLVLMAAAAVAAYLPARRVVVADPLKSIRSE